MKNVILFFSFLFIAPTLIFAQKDEAAIKEVLVAETQAFLDRDFDAMAIHWDQSENATHSVAGTGTVQKGWEAVSTSMKGYFKNNPEADNADFSNGDYMFSIQGDHAFVTFKQTMTPEFKAKNNDELYSSTTYQVRSLVKSNGQWKIIHVVTSPIQSEDSDANVTTHLRLASRMLNRMGRTEEAAKIPEMVMEMFPDIPDGYWGAGWYAFSKKDKGNAIKYLEKAIALFDGEAPANLKNLYEEAKKME